MGGEDCYLCKALGMSIYYKPFNLGEGVNNILTAVWGAGLAEEHISCGMVTEVEGQWCMWEPCEYLASHSTRGGSERHGDRDGGSEKKFETEKQFEVKHFGECIASGIGKELEETRMLFNHDGSPEIVIQLSTRISSKIKREEV